MCQIIFHQPSRLGFKMYSSLLMSRLNIDQIDSEIKTSADFLSQQSTGTANDIRDVLASMRLTLIIVSAVMLSLVFLEFLFSIFGMQVLVYTLVIFGWILVTASFKLCGTFLLFHKNGKEAWISLAGVLLCVTDSQESFAPIVEVVSGHDLIPAMVYGRNVGGQEYGGMYCAVLTVKSVVVSAAIFRVFGSEVAELPLVATSSGNHGKGYFQALFACIEGLLTTLKIKTFVLPAAEEAKSIWTDRFGFKKMTPDQLGQLKSNFWSMVRFEGTSMLHKRISECTSVQSSGVVIL